MISSLFSQKNICAALGLAMAFTIVWKAKVETKLAQHTALIEYTEPTYNTGMTSNSEADQALEYQKIRTEYTVLR